MADTTQSRLSAAVNRYLDYFGWSPPVAAKEIGIDKNTIYKILNDPAYRPTEPVRQALVKGFNLSKYEDIWKDPFATDTLHEHSPPQDKECLRLEDIVEDPNVTIRDRPLSPFQREMFKWVLGLRPDPPTPEEFV